MSGFVREERKSNTKIDLKIWPAIAKAICIYLSKEQYYRDKLSFWSINIREKSTRKFGELLLCNLSQKQALFKIQIPRATQNHK